MAQSTIKALKIVNVTTQSEEVTVNANSTKAVQVVFPAQSGRIPIGVSALSFNNDTDSSAPNFVGIIRFDLPRTSSAATKWFTLINASTTKAYTGYIKATVTYIEP